MPKTKIDYSNGTIYKIVCKDPNVKDCYVGSTTNLKQRKAQHRACCKSSNRKNNKYPVYQCMRENGGRDNWDIVEIEKYPCNGYEELHKRERYWLETLGATLNVSIPSRTKKQWHEEYIEHGREYQKQYSIEHRDKRLEYAKKVYENNKIEISNYKKKQYEKNKEKVCERTKQYREANKIKVKCDCGSSIYKYCLSFHIQTKKHQSYINSLVAQQDHPLEDPVPALSEMPQLQHQ